MYGLCVPVVTMTTKRRRKRIHLGCATQKGETKQVAQTEIGNLLILEPEPLRRMSFVFDSGSFVVSLDPASSCPSKSITMWRLSFL